MEKSEIQKNNIEERLSKLLKTPGLDKILELTYTYKPTYEINGRKIYFNKDIFETFLGKTFPEKPELTQEELNELKILINEKTLQIILEFHRLLIDLRENTDIQETKKNIIIEAINYNITILHYFLNSLEFELEKAGYKIKLSQEEISKRTKKNEEYEKLLYGGKIIDNEEEALRCYDYMVTESEKNKEKINPEKYKELQGYLEKIKKALEERLYEVGTRFIYNKNVNKETQDFLNIFGKLELDRETYMQIFDMIFEALGLRQRTRLTGALSVYDGPEYLDIPDNGKFAKLQLDRIIKLISHEILGHAVNQRNHELYFGDLRGAGNLEKEEGIAKVLESGMYLGENIFTVNPISPEFILLLAGEVLETEELYRFIDIFGTLTRKLTTDEGRLLRCKRNQPINGVGVQHKDTTYIRGLIKITEYLGNGGDITKFFNGKIGIDDITSGKIDFSQNNDFLITFFIVDIIIYKVLYKKYEEERKKNPDFKNPLKRLNKESFKEFLKRKYNYLGIDFDRLLNDSSRFQKMVANKVFKIIELKINL